MARARIVGLGGYQPGEPIDNETVERLVGGLPDEVMGGLSIERRFWLVDPETGEHRENNSDLALKASLLAHQWPWEERTCETEPVRLGKSSRWVAPTHAWLQRLSDDAGGAPKGRTIVAVGAPGPAILGRAQVNGADLIVVGRNACGPDRR